MKVYIAGTISKGGTLSEAEIRANLKKFEEAELELRAKGYEVFNPASVALSIALETPRGELPPSWWTFEGWVAAMRAGLKELLDCDAIYLIPGWEESAGVQLEVTIARKFKMLELGP